jgi:glucosamine--fructose-6-phosphate aminotransferase (isomerizing)
MCGIVGYIGNRVATPLLIDGLKRLEYRGYDSAGIAIMNGKGVETRKAAGKISKLETAVTSQPVHGSLGIAHTRWATHGAPTEGNAHPHLCCKSEIAVVHNGIIENATALRQTLEERGHEFTSETDTEVIAHLIEELFDGSLEDAVIQALLKIEGTYGIAVISSADPKKIVAARKGSPLLVGLGDGEYFIASDVSAILAHTRQVVYLDVGDLAVLEPTGYRIIDLNATEQQKKVSKIDWDLDQIERGGFAHFMLKEIFEQPTTIENCMRGRLLRAIENLTDLARQSVHRLDDLTSAKNRQVSEPPELEREQQQRHDLARKRFRRRDADLRPGVDVNAAVGLAGDRRANDVYDA